VETDVEIEGDAWRTLAAAVRLVNLAVEAGVRVLACQRVVHPKVELLARRSKLLILPRLGRQTVSRVEEISGAKPIRGDIGNVDSDLVERSQGRLKNIHHEVIGGVNYLVLGGDYFTLMLHPPTTEVSPELSVSESGPCAWSVVLFLHSFSNCLIHRFPNACSTFI